MKPVDRIGWIASALTTVTSLSFIDQIRLNLEGHKGSVILAFLTTLNCIFWVLYGLMKKPKEWGIFTCNLIGGILSLVAGITGM